MSSKNKELLEYLEKPRAIRTLLCLYKSENKGLDEVLKIIGGSKSTGMERISELQKMGLVEKKASATVNRKMLYCLEKRGKRIAEGIQKILQDFEENARDS
jgi:DNA-binding MarR family transcriptional regulator